MKQRLVHFDFVGFDAEFFDILIDRLGGLVPQLFRARLLRGDQRVEMRGDGRLSALQCRQRIRSSLKQCEQIDWINQ
jgi:hypothetical protein